jgi:hypothetical protein
LILVNLEGRIFWQAQLPVRLVRLCDPPNLSAEETRTMRYALPLIALLLCTAQAPEVVHPPPGVIEVAAADGRGHAHMVARHVTRIFRNENLTLIDTAGFYRQRSAEPVDAVARKVIAAGRRMVALTDPSQQRIWLAADAVTAVRESREFRADGVRTVIALIGLLHAPDVGVRESPEEVLAALQRALAEPERPAVR